MMLAYVISLPYWNIAVNNTMCVTSLLVMCLVFDVVLLSERIRHLASATFTTREGID